jgi:hypothetical protein
MEADAPLVLKRRQYRARRGERFFEEAILTRDGDFASTIKQALRAVTPPFQRVAPGGPNEMAAFAIN